MTSPPAPTAVLTPAPAPALAEPRGTDDLDRRGVMLVLSSPSGAGKTTIARLLQEQEPNLRMSISVTTRPRRPSEVDGRDYQFVDADAFQAMVKKKELLEHAQVFGNSYGTPRAPVERALQAGQDVLFDIDWQGTKQLAKAAREDLVAIFILPPSAQALESRLRSRAQDTEEVIRGRMDKAAQEISHYDEYDYVVVNADVQKSLDEVRSILAAERLKRKRRTGLPAFVDRLTTAL